MVMFIIAGSRMSAATWSPMSSRTRSSRSASLKGMAFVSSLTARGWPAPKGTLRGHVAVAELVQRRAHADHHGVVVAVVGALDLQHQVAAGGGAREVDGVHRGLGAGVGEAPLRQAEAAHELLGDDDRALGGRGEVRAAPGALAHRGHDGRVGVAHAHHAEAVVEVDVLVAVDVPHVRALAVGEVDRPRVGGLEGARHATRHDGQRALVVALRALRCSPAACRARGR